MAETRNNHKQGTNYPAEVRANQTWGRGRASRGIHRDRRRVSRQIRNSGYSGSKGHSSQASSTSCDH